MTIIFYDNRTIQCDTIYIYEKEILVDGRITIPLIEVLRIISD